MINFKGQFNLHKYLSINGFQEFASKNDWWSTTSFDAQKYATHLQGESVLLPIPVGLGNKLTDNITFKLISMFQTLFSGGISIVDKIKNSLSPAPSRSRASSVDSESKVFY